MSVAESQAPTTAAASGSAPPATPYLDAANATPLEPSPAIRHTAAELGNDGLPLIGHTLHFVRDARSLIDRMRNQHGANFRLSMFGKPMLAVGSPEAVKAVLMDKEKNFSSRLGWTHAIGELFARGLMLRDFEEHRVHRRILQSAFRADALRGYAEMMNPIIDRGLDDWVARTRENPQMRFYDAIKQLTLDLGAEVFVGTTLGPEADEINQAFVDSVQASIAIVKKEVPGLSYKRGMDGRRLLEKFFSERIDARRSGNGRDMFSEFCRARSDDGEEFDDQQIVDHMIFLLMAAHDTTTSSLTSMMWALAQHPEWQERLREEYAALGTAHLAYADRDRAKETEWVFKEALRLFPPVPFIGRRAVRDCVVDGIEIPANTPISIISLITHFLPEYWPEPHRFDPTRFSPERAEDRQHSHCWYPFGGGAHTCLGMHFAYLQIKAFLHQFLLRFRVTLPPGHELDMTPIPIPKPKDGLPLRFEQL